MLLAIDTATQIMSVALYDGQSLLAEQTWNTHNNHTTELAPSVRALFARAELTMDALTAVAVSTGPGSYSGLRVGVSFAKALASARHLPLIGMSSLDTVAAGTPNYGGGLIVVLQAGRGRLIVKTYRWRKGHWSSHKSEEPQLMDWEALISKIDGPAFVTGEVNSEGLQALRQAQDNNVSVTLVPSAFRLRRAGFLAEEAWQRLQETADPKIFAPAKLLPFYIKTKDIP
jgi:tRNA threonylcarbamoyladenosine biosynthesis protein TsaB